MPRSGKFTRPGSQIAEAFEGELTTEQLFDCAKFPSASLERGIREAQSIDEAAARLKVDRIFIRSRMHQVRQNAATHETHTMNIESRKPKELTTPRALDGRKVKWQFQT